MLLVLLAALALVVLASKSSLPASLAQRGLGRLSRPQTEELAFGFMPYDEEEYVSKDPVSPCKRWGSMSENVLY